MISIFIVLAFVFFKGSFYIDNFSKFIESKKTDVEKNEWFVMEKEGFKVSFPEEPVDQSVDVPVVGKNVNLKMDMYIHEASGESAYMVNVSTYPEEVGALDLSGAMDGMTKSNGGNEIIASNEEDFKGNVAVSYKLKNKIEEGVFIQGKAFIVDRKLYQLMYLYRGEDGFNESDYDKFMNSFELK